ncbi:MAG TPA: cysteine desulfurase family protein [Verrucomicrobiae bacterium]|jgi:cysteine desulfurase|nr:cysteine desulfurase family protein [Verrucomicrobiae bacterium]
MRHVFLDHQSATPVLPEALEAMQPFFAGAFGNPSSPHQHGLRARDALEAARAQVANLINAAAPEEIIFTSDGTESANLAVKGTAWAQQRRGKHIVVSSIEHPAVLNSAAFLEKHGFTCARVGVDAQGFVDPERIRAAITDKTILIAVHLVNHEIGTLEPIPEIAAIAHEKGIPLYVDAEAAVGWLSADVQALGADLLSFSPHRFYGPKGVGVLYRHRRARMQPLLHGGDQEGGRRAGVENLPGIVGAGVAAEIAQRELPRRAAHCARLQKRLWDGLRASVPRLTLNGPEPGPHRSPVNLNISTEGTEGEGQLLLLDTRGIAVASGSACVTKSLRASHVLEAIGLEPALAQAAIILSLGQDNTDQDIDYVLETFPKIAAKLRSLSPSWKE